MLKKTSLSIFNVVAAFIACCISAPQSAAQAPPISGNWTLTFQDEFNGSKLDGDKWQIGQHWEGIAGGGANNPANISLANGKLRLTSTLDPFTYSGTSRSKSTGEVSTFKNFRQRYGYMEARIKYPAVQGLWPAFWLMPDRAEYGWKDSNRRSYLKFNLSSLGSTTVSSATLQLKVSSIQSGGNSNMLVFPVEDDSWSESTITWNNAPAWNPLWIKQIWNSTASAGDTISIDVKDFVQAEMNGDKKVSFALADTFMRDKLMQFHSSEAASSADRPKLVVNGTTFYPTGDATIRWGTLADTNYGSNTILNVEDNWGNTADTFNGGMEIDIMESLGIWGANETSHVLHWDGYGGSHQSQGFPDITFPATSDNFHTYGLYWEDDLVEFYVDGVKTASWSNSRVMSTHAYIILSLQLGGWDGNSAGSQVDNQVMEVDYVRVWSGTKTGGSGSIAGTKNIINSYSGKALRPKDAAAGDDVNIVQYTLSPTWNSLKWDIVDVGGGYYKIQNKYTGKALRPLAAGTADDVQIVQYTYSSTWDTQKWKFLDAGNGKYQIQNKYSSKVLRPLNAGTGDDVNIIQYTLNPTWTTQHWSLVDNP